LLIGVDYDADHYLVILAIGERLSLKKEMKKNLGADKYKLN
jgi:hypothetical protein